MTLESANTYHDNGKRCPQPIVAGACRTRWSGQYLHRQSRNGGPRDMVA